MTCEHPHVVIDANLSISLCEACARSALEQLSAEHLRAWTRARELAPFVNSLATRLYLLHERPKAERPAKPRRSASADELLQQIKEIIDS